MIIVCLFFHFISLKLYQYFNEEKLGTIIAINKVYNVITFKEMKKKMAKKTIMLVCSAGMSTSLLVTKMQKAAEDRGMEADIFAVSASEADTNLENKEVNVLLLGPQVRFMKGQFEQKLQPKGIPLDVINMADYGMMNGEKVLDQAISLMGSSN
ncbi:PTS system, cellobiose-specific IIB component [Enterococcus faecalis CBRD01]|nr:PTS system, cellobiose-specific IIB component [Enterococcus faecalis CBRD01]